MKVFILTIIVVWVLAGEKHAGTQNMPNQFPTMEACNAELENLKKTLPERFQQQGATDVEVYGDCQMWGKSVKK